MARVQSDMSGPSRTKQHHKRECDINVIVRNYQKTGVFKHVQPKEAKYGDFTESHDLQDSINRVNEARAAFMELPARVRQAADNNPVTFLAMLADEGGAKALIDAGLPVIERAKETTDTPSEGSNPTT